MSESPFSNTEFRLAPDAEGPFEIWEARDDSSDVPDEQLYSCVALSTLDEPNGWPALGGTRRVHAPVHVRDAVHIARNEAMELAQSMQVKNTILRRSEESCRRRGVSGFDAGGPPRFGWLGGKGVIWTPRPAGADHTLGGLNPLRLMRHGELLETMPPVYLGSKDAGVGSVELSWIGKTTSRFIGLGCGRDTGEATAEGVLSALLVGAERMPKQFGAGRSGPLDGVVVLVVGAGKVGLPLIQRLVTEHEADVRVFDPAMLDPRSGVPTADSVDRFLSGVASLGAEIDDSHRRTLRDLARRGRVFESESDALADPEVQIVSPNGGPTRWLSSAVTDGSGQIRAERLAAVRKDGGRLAFIAGGGNDQIPTTDRCKDEREAALRTLVDAGILFVPDPLVSPGGVISVSYEQVPPWRAEVVNDAARRIVRRSVEEMFDRSNAEPASAYPAFTDMLSAPWF